jgi:hypothetical protein
MLHRACCALPASFCSQLPRLTLRLPLRCFVLLWFALVCFGLLCFVCLIACLRPALAKHTIDGAAIRRTRVVAR